MDKPLDEVILLQPYLLRRISEIRQKVTLHKVIEVVRLWRLFPNDAILRLNLFLLVGGKT